MDLWYVMQRVLFIPSLFVHKTRVWLASLFLCYFVISADDNLSCILTTSKNIISWLFLLIFLTFFSTSFDVIVTLCIYSSSQYYLFRPL